MSSRNRNLSSPSLVLLLEYTCTQTANRSVEFPVRNLSSSSLVLLLAYAVWRTEGETRVLD